LKKSKDISPNYSTGSISVEKSMNKSSLKTLDISVACGIYFHPEAYPPTLYALDELAPTASNIYVIHRPHLKNEWSYAFNVQLIPSGRPLEIKQQEKSNLLKKIFYFLQFTWTLYKIIQSKKVDLVILYDTMPLFSFALIRRFLRNKVLVWYHNHDVVELSQMRKYSIGWFAAKWESKMFRHLDIFSLPSMERKKYFPIQILKGEFVFLPNRPSKKFYNRFLRSSKPQNGIIKLIYQGSITSTHGLEEIISILDQPIGEHQLELHLAGRISKEYQDQLTQLANDYQVSSQVIFHGLLPYKKLPALTTSCDIGIAINKPVGIIYQTGGTASNKIYEYVACGLPVLYYNIAHYREHLEKYSWAVPTNLSSSSLLSAIREIVLNYEAKAQSADEDFENELNYEKAFQKVAQVLETRLTK
jgi:hypothetical protein